MKIAVYGGVGSGKSMVAGFLKNNHNAYVFEADKIAHRLYEKNQPGNRIIRNMFGKDLVDNSGNIDRKKLSERLFGNPKAVDKVNKKIHPLVFRYFRNQCDEILKNDPGALIVYEAAVPSHHLADFDSVWYIKTPYEKRLQLLAENRGYSKEKTDAIIASQHPDEYFEKLADIIIINDGTLKELEKKTDEAYEHCQRQLG